MNPEESSLTIAGPPPGGVTIKRKGPRFFAHIRPNTASWLVVEIGRVLA
jgi:hypothetical protein